MKMDDITPGEIYRRANNRGRDGISISTQHVMVDATHVAKQFSTRYDRVQVHNVTPDCDADGNFLGSYTYTGAYDADGNPYRYLLMAKEIVSLEEAKREEEERRQREEERKRRIKAQNEYERTVEKTIGARLGVDHNLIDCTVVHKGEDDEGNYIFEPYRASVNGRGLVEMMSSDPDPILIAEILDEIEPEVLREMSSEELANHIVGGLRYDPAPADDEIEEIE